MGWRKNEPPESLGAWLDVATRRLSTNSSLRVREEIREHFDSAREDALASGAGVNEADRRALESLGDAREVNRRYRKVLLTDSEASLSARIASSETRTRRALILFAGFAAFVLSINVYQGDVREVALWIGVIVVQLCYLAPAKSAAQARALRCFRLCVTAALPFGMSDWGMFVIVAGIMAALLLPIELRHATLRRKLPVEEWPTGLFN